MPIEFETGKYPPLYSENGFNNQEKEFSSLLSDFNHS